MTELNNAIELNVDNKASMDGNNYTDLLAMAHLKGLKCITVEVIQLPSAANKLTAICRATVNMGDNKVFSDIADARPSSENDASLSESLVMLASTRAKSRALRDALGVALKNVTEEEQKQDEPERRNFPEATIKQINAIKKLCKQLGRQFEPEFVTTLNRVAASRLIGQLTEKLEKIS